MYEGKFLGEYKIVEDGISEYKTPLGNEIKMIKTEDGKTHHIPAIIIERLLTEEAVDASTFRDIRIKPIAEKVLEVLAEYDMMLQDADYLTQIMVGSLKESSRLATDILWKKDHRTALDVDRVLKANGTTLEDILKEEDKAREK